MTYEQVQAQLAGVTYQSAINYYNMQRKQFINDYSLAIQDASGELGKKYIDEFFNDINSSKFQGQAFGLSNDLAERLSSALTAAMDSVNLSQFDALITDTSKQYSELTKKGQQELLNALLTFFDLNIIHQELEQSLKQMKMSNGGINANDIISWSKSYLLSKFYNRLRGQEATYGRRTVLAGYFEEALVHKATNRLTKHLKNKAGAFQTGSKRISSSRGSIESVFDEYFNFFSNDIGTAFEESIIIDKNELVEGYGAQVKLWNAPWNISKPRKSYSISSNANLFNAWGERRSWIQGVLYLQDKVREAMGDNVMYILGNSIHWTADLISKFRENNYYLAFNHNGKEFTQTVAWETINMAKPYGKD